METSISNRTNIIFTVITVLLHIKRMMLLGNLNTSFIAYINVNIPHQINMTYVGSYLIS